MKLEEGYTYSNRERFSQLLRWRGYLANVLSIPQLSKATKEELKALYEDCEREIEYIVETNKGVIL